MPVMSEWYALSKEGLSKSLQYMLFLLKDPKKEYNYNDFLWDFQRFSNTKRKIVNLTIYNLCDRNIIKYQNNSDKETVKLDVIKTMFFIHRNPVKVVIRKELKGKMSRLI